MGWVLSPTTDKFGALHPDSTREWIDKLRALGVKAAHPNDGWVDRDLNRVHLTYPHFAGRLEVGDLLALGSPTYGTRIVRVTGFEENRFAIGLGGLNDPRRWYVTFEDALV